MIHLVTTRLTIGFHTQVFFPYHNYDFCFVKGKRGSFFDSSYNDPFCLFWCWYYFLYFDFVFSFAHRFIFRLSKFKPSLVFTLNQLILILSLTPCTVLNLVLL
jgi:hypothetical protein